MPEFTFLSHNFGGREMGEELDNRVKAAMNETRLLILGVQVLLGFQFACFFQDGFATLADFSKLICAASLVLIIISVGALMAPSMIHRLAERDGSSSRLIRTTNAFAGMGLAPITAALGLSAYVVLDRHFGKGIGVIGGSSLTALAAIGWFGLELLTGLQTKIRAMEQSTTPLSIKIDQLLTEARVIIPGGQALFGFQFLAMLTSGFDKLPQTVKALHATALVLIAINVVLLMTPAALHRLSFGGEDSQSFFKMGSAFVIAAPLFLAGGIALEFYVVMQKIHASEGWAGAASALIFLGLFALWYVLPLALRHGRSRSGHPILRKVA